MQILNTSLCYLLQLWFRTSHNEVTQKANRVLVVFSYFKLIILKVEFSYSCLEG